MSSLPLPIITAQQAAATTPPLAGQLNPLTWEEKGLYGGAITVCIPKRFTDCSDFRQIPSHQEVYADADTDQSIIIELNSFDDTVSDEQAAAHYQTELGVANEAFSTEFLSAGAISSVDMPGFGEVVCKTFCVSAQRISKFKESAEKANSVQIYMAVVRLKHVTTDLLISFNVPLAFAHGSSSEGRSIMDSQENVAVIQGVLKTIRVKDWGLFGAEAGEPAEAAPAGEMDE